jgi:hypothetical protein
MTLHHLTGVQGYIKLDSVTWADANVTFVMSQASATAARGGKWSDLNLPGKKSCTITAKNIMRTAARMGGMLTDTSTSGTAGTVTTAFTIAADGWHASTTPTIATPSRIRLTVGTAPLTVAGVVTIIGTDVNGDPLEEAISIGLIGIGEYVTGTKLFKTVTGCYNTTAYSATGTLTMTSLAGASSYETTANPKSYALEFGGYDSVTGNTIYVVVDHAFASKSGLAYADANTVFMDDVSFTVEDIDADVHIYEVTTN